MSQSGPGSNPYNYTPEQLIAVLAERVTGLKEALATQHADFEKMDAETRAQIKAVTDRFDKLLFASLGSMATSIGTLIFYLLTRGK